ncbi:MAG TPA: hypothetical protein VH561_04650 [Micromonosporaceae bacterium]
MTVTGDTTVPAHADTHVSTRRHPDELAAQRAKRELAKAREYLAFARTDRRLHSDDPVTRMLAESFLQYCTDRMRRLEVAS